MARLFTTNVSRSDASGSRLMVTQRITCYYVPNVPNIRKKRLPVAVKVNISITDESPFPTDVSADSVISYLVEGNTDSVKLICLTSPTLLNTCSLVGDSG